MLLTTPAMFRAFTATDTDVVLLQTTDPVRALTICAKSVQTARTSFACVAQPAAALHAVEPRQHQIEDDEIEQLAEPGLDAGDAIADRRHGVTVAAQEVRDAFAQARLVFDHQDTHRSSVSRTAWPRVRRT